MIILAAASTPAFEPWPPMWSWPWWSGFGMPVIAAIASTLVGVAAVWIALSVAHRDRADRLRRDQQESFGQRDRVLMRSETAVREMSAVVRSKQVTPTMAASVVSGALQREARVEGLGDASVASLVKWMMREVSVLEPSISGPILNPRPDQWNHMLGCIAYDLELSDRLGEWRNTGAINSSATVAERYESLLAELPSAPGQTGG